MLPTRRTNLINVVVLEGFFHKYLNELLPITFLNNPFKVSHSKGSNGPTTKPRCLSVHLSVSRIYFTNLIGR